MPIHRFNQSISPLFISIIEWSKNTTTRYDAHMPIELGINAKFVNSCCFRGDLNRQPFTGGGHKPVSYQRGGIPSGIRRMQKGFSLNTRIVLSETTRKPDNFWLFVIFIRETTMTALSACISKDCSNPAIHNNLGYTSTPTGIIAYHDGLPVAWIVLGFHKGQLNNRTHTSRFVDVAYYRATCHGVNLETLEADSLEQALQALEIMFSDLPHSVQKAELSRLFATRQPAQPLNKAKLQAHNPFARPAVEVAA